MIVPAMSLPSVDLPAPDGPTIPRTSPGSRAKRRSRCRTGHVVPHQAACSRIPARAKVLPRGRGSRMPGLTGDFAVMCF